MASEDEALRVDIIAETQGEAEIRKLRAELDRLRHDAHSLNHEVHEEGLSFALLAERSETVREHFGELGETFGETNEQLAEMIPLFELFAAGASIAGLVELTKSTAEARTQLRAMATEIGISVDKLEELRLAAAETDVPVEAMQGGLVKLQRAMVDAASGKNKDVAAIFGHMGIALRDAHGHMRSVDQVLPLIAESLSRTHDTTLRNAVAMRLFGRSGAELIPMLNLGHAGLERLAHTAERLDAALNGEQEEAIERYKNDWVELETVIDSLKEIITADLAPVLGPIVEDFRDWVAANKEWLGSSIRHDVEMIRDDVANMHLDRFIADLAALKSYVDPLAEMAGGWHRIAEALVIIAGLRLAYALTAPIRSVGRLIFDLGQLSWKLNRDVAGAWRHVGDVAEGAAIKEEIAAHAGGGIHAGGAAAHAAAKEGEEAAETALKSTASKAFLRGMVAEGLAAAGGLALEGAAGLAGLALGGAEIAAAASIVYGLLHLPHWLDELVHAFGPSHEAPVGMPGGRGSVHPATIAPNQMGTTHIVGHGAQGHIVGELDTIDAVDISGHLTLPEGYGVRHVGRPHGSRHLPKGIAFGGEAPVGERHAEGGEHNEVERESSARERSAEGGGAGDETEGAPGRARAATGTVTVNVRFENAPDGLSASFSTSGIATPGDIDYGQNHPFGGSGL